MDDGTDLFGAGTRNALAELSAYERNKNCRIDGSGGIFGDLFVWMKDEEDPVPQHSLRDAGGEPCISMRPILPMP
jgi:hypothetical protein